MIKNDYFFKNDNKKLIFKIINLITQMTYFLFMDKQYAFAVILIILGVGLSQSGTTNTFYSGLGIGIIGLGIFWVVIRLIKELKR